MAQVKPIPPGTHTITPTLTLNDAAGAIDFYKRAFGAEEVGRFPAPDGKKIMHAALRIGDSPLWLADEVPEAGGCRSARTLGGTPVGLHLYVEYVDAIFDRAVKAGATATAKPENMFWGDRMARVTDPYGFEWSIASRVEEVAPEEMQRRGQELFQQRQAKRP